MFKVVSGVSILSRGPILSLPSVHSLPSTASLLVSGPTERLLKIGQYFDEVMTETYVAYCFGHSIYMLVFYYFLFFFSLI